MLIKLLAGIAINAVLASLLLPALAQEPKADAMQSATWCPSDRQLQLHRPHAQRDFYIARPLSFCENAGHHCGSDVL